MTVSPRTGRFSAQRRMDYGRLTRVFDSYSRGPGRSVGPDTRWRRATSRDGRTSGAGCGVRSGNGRPGPGGGHPRGVRAGGPRLPGVLRAARDQRTWARPDGGSVLAFPESLLDRWAKSSLFWVVSNFRPGLRLADVDWRGATIAVVQQKTGNPLPLPPLVVGKLCDYVLGGRPATADEHVFVRSVAPHVHLADHASVHQVISATFAAAGVADGTCGTAPRPGCCARRCRCRLGPLNTRRPPQGRPEVSHAGGSPRGDFAARSADIMLARKERPLQCQRYRLSPSSTWTRRWMSCARLTSREASPSFCSEEEARRSASSSRPIPGCWTLSGHSPRSPTSSPRSGK